MPESSISHFHHTFNSFSVKAPDRHIIDAEFVLDFLQLDFIPWRWERYDLLILKDRFFEPAIQQFLGLLHEKRFQELAAEYMGYDLSASGRMIFPPAPPKN